MAIIKENVLVGQSVLVTGGAGFLGTHFLLGLRDFSARLFATQHEQKPFLETDTIKFLPCDLTKPEDCLRVTQDKQVVIHCASNTSGAKVMRDNPGIHVTANNLMNNHLLEAAGKNHVQHFVLISSSAIYPDVDYPVKEEEGFKGEPHQAYQGVGWMKRYAEKMAAFFGRIYNMKIYIVRPSQIIGPYSHTDEERAHMIPALIARALTAQDELVVWGSPDVTRDFIYAEDFVKVVIEMLTQQMTGPMNIASGMPATTQDVVDLIVEHIGRLRQYRPLKVTFDATKPTTIHKRLMNIELAQSLKLLPLFTSSLSEAIQQTVNWQAQQPS